MLFILLVAFFGLTQLLLPPLAGGLIEMRLKELTHTQEVKAMATSTPAIRMLMGDVGEVKIRTHNALLGDVKVSELTLDGEGVNIPFMELKTGFKINGARRLIMTGTFTNEDLSYLIEKRFDSLKNVKVEIKPDLIRATGELSLGGKAEVMLEGKVFSEKQSIYFHMTRFHVKNSLLGKLGGSLFGDIEILDFNKLKLPVELDKVEQEDGRARVVASRH